MGTIGGAWKLAERAHSFYEQSLNPILYGKEVGYNRSIPFSNLGELSILLAEISASRGTLRSGMQSPEQYYSEAEIYFNNAISEFQANPFAILGLGGVYAGREELDRAERQLQEVLRQWPRFALAYIRLGELFVQRGELSEQRRELRGAVAQFRRAIQLDPNYSLAYFKMAQTLDGIQEYDEALTYYQEYLRLELPIFIEGNRVKTTRTQIISIQERRGLAPGR